jgi:RND family efflux transporter MFP subunit
VQYGDDEASIGAQKAGEEALGSGAPHDGHEAAAEEGRASVQFGERTGRRIKSVAVGVLVVLVLAFAVTFFFKSREQTALASESKDAADQRPIVTVITAQPATGERLLTLPGETAAWYESTIYGRVNGYVAAWHADIGDHVHRGETLATIDTPELDAQLAAARAQLNAAQSQVVVREAESELATTTYARWRDSPKGVVSEQEREEKHADFDSAIARLNAARAQVAVNQADVDHYAALAQFKRVVAPIDGTIVERRIDIGNLVTAGSTAATTSLYRISQDKPMRVFVDVPQRASVELMKPGLPVQIRANNLPGRIFSGRIARSSRAINTQARTLKVEVDLPNDDLVLVPGMYVDVAFELAAGQLLQVPAAALMFRTSGPQVAVVDPDGHIRFKAVTIARDQGTVVELGSGVNPGDKVALNVSSQINDGAHVTSRDSLPVAAPPAPAEKSP